MVSDVAVTARIALAALCLRGIERILDDARGARLCGGQNLGVVAAGWRPLRRRQWERVIGLIRIGGLQIDDLPDALELAGLGWIGDRLRLPGLLDVARRLVEERQVCTAICDQYPARWQNKLGETAPGAVWWNGVDWRPAGCECDIPLRPHVPVIAVVGSRDPEPVASGYATTIGRVIRSSGYVFCSGGAPGVDTLAAQSFCEGVDCGETEGREDFVASGYGGFIVTPRFGWRQVDVSLARVMTPDFDGLVNADFHTRSQPLAEFSCNPPWAAFSTAAAMERNQLIYAAADAAVILQPGYRKGGTWHGAISAHRLRLCQLIVPVDPGCLATRALIALGATPLNLLNLQCKATLATPEEARVERDRHQAPTPDGPEPAGNYIALALKECMQHHPRGKATQRALGL